VAAVPANVEVMDSELREQLDKLERTAAELEVAAKKALGFVSTLEYMGITFNVSRRFVIADMSPLAFFHLVEHIDDGIESAVVRLYYRLTPLLTCRHQWTPLKRSADEQVRGLAKAGPQVCSACTAYALGHSLPVVGRSLSDIG